MRNRSVGFGRRPVWRRPAAAAGLALCLLAVLVATPTAASAQAAAGTAAAARTWPAHRVWDTRAERFTDFETVAAAAAGAGAVLFGEQHGDTPTHRLQLALLERLSARGQAFTLSLEMFERDTQPLLDGYLAGVVTEADFLAGARPWPNHAADYRPLVELARAAGRPVLASNVPRELASRVAREGLAALDALSPAERRLAAAQNLCPEDDYRARFLEVIGRHPMGAPLPPAEEAARAERYYESQCVKDEAMAESIATALASGHVVVHMNGAFHSDFGQGTADRVLRRAPGTVLLIVSAVPVADLDAIDTAEHARRADFVIFTERAR
jgi:uncharacterized iron-regulated protein